MLGAAAGGADVADLAGLAGEIYARSLPRDKIKDKDEDGDAEEGQESGGEEDEAFADRCVRVETTFQGAGVLTGDLSPECASIVATVLDALSAPAGRRMPGASRSGAMTLCRRRCGGWSAPGCCPSGPGNPLRPWCTCPWPT